MANLDGAVVMITGASRGLGSALALAFAENGARLSLCARSETSLDSLRERLRDRGHEPLVVSADVSDQAAVARWVDRTVLRLGKPAVLINNASVLGPRLPLAEFPIEQWRHVLEVNLTGTVIATQEVLRHMRSARSGSIVNVSSGAAIPPRVHWGAYAVSKDALEGFTRNLAAELEETGIRVNTVDPGAMRTDMRADAYPEEDPTSVKEPISIAPLFLWLASNDSRDVTGQRFQADEWLRQAREG